MTGRNFQITTCHDIWAQTNPNRVTMPELVSKFSKIRNAVNINVYTDILCFFYFFKRNIIRSIKNVLWFKPSLQCQLYFVDGTAINITTNRKNVFENINVCQSFSS